MKEVIAKNVTTLVNSALERIQISVQSVKQDYIYKEEQLHLVKFAINQMVIS